MAFSLRHAALLGFAGGVAYSLYEPHRLVVRRFDVKIPNLPRAADGLRIAQLSDIHCSAITGSGVLNHAVAVCNAEEPDIVALTGDFVSRRNSYNHLTLARLWARDITVYAERVAEAVAQLRAPEGVFAVPGNHDHTQGNCAFIAELLARSGARMLVNETVRVRGVLPLIGLDDLRAGRPDLRRATPNVSPDEAQVILCHNPRFLPRVAQRNCFVIAGHTHGGQVHLPGTRFRRRPHDMHFSVWQEGWYRYERAQMFVSVGVGSVSFPMRFACPPELPIFTLRRG